MSNGKPDRASTTPKSTYSPTAAQRRLASERAEAARKRIATAQRRRRILAVGGSVAAVLLVVAALVIVKVVTGAGGPKSGDKSSKLSAEILAKVASVPEATLNSIGAGTITSPPTRISAPALTSGGKPQVLYIGAEYCPYCAAERWAVAVALSRFGTLHDVGQTTSSPSDVYPSTNTLSFHGASFTSSYLAFTAKEIQSNQVVNGQYASLDKLTPAEQAIFSKYDAAPYVKSSGIPFVDIGGKYVISGASYDPGVLQGKSYAQIADALADPTSTIARAVDGTANVVSAAICAITDQKPATVCTSAGVKAAAGKLSAGS